MLSSPYTHTVPMMRTNTSGQSSVQVQSLVQNIHKLIHLLEKKIDDKAFRNVQREFCKLLNETTRALSTHHTSSLITSNERNMCANTWTSDKMMKINCSKQSRSVAATKNVDEVSASSESNAQFLQHEKSQYKSVDVGTLPVHRGNKLYRAHSAASEPTHSCNGLTHSSPNSKSKQQQQEEYEETGMLIDHEDTVLHDSLDLTSPIRTLAQEEHEQKELQQEEKGNNREKTSHRTRATSASTLSRQSALPIPHTLSPQPVHNTWTSHHVNHSQQGNTHISSNVSSQPSPLSLRSPARTTNALFSSIESSELSPSSVSSSSLSSSSLSSLVWSTSALRSIANHSAVWSIVLSAFFVRKKKKIPSLAFTCLESLLLLFNSCKEEHYLEKETNGEEECDPVKHANNQREWEQERYKQHKELKNEFARKQKVCAGELQPEDQLADILNKVIPIFVKDDGTICNNSTGNYNNTNINSSKDNNTWIPSVKSSCITPPPYSPTSSSSSFQSQHEYHLSPLSRSAKHNAKPSLVLHKCFTAQAIYFALSEYISNTLLTSSSSLFNATSSSLLSVLASLQSSSSSSSNVIDQQEESRLLRILQLMLSQSSVSEQLNGACLVHLTQACFLLTIHSATRKLQSDAGEVLEQIVIHTVHRFIIYAEPLYDSNDSPVGDNVGGKDYNEDNNRDINCNVKKNDDTFHCSTVLSNYLHDVQDNEPFIAMDVHNGYKMQMCDEVNGIKNNCNDNVKNEKRWGQINDEVRKTREFSNEEMDLFFRPHENTNYATAEDRVSNLAINVVDEKGQLPIPLKDLLKLIRQCCQVGSMTCTGNATENNNNNNNTISIKARHVALRLLCVILHELPVCNCTQEHRCAHWLELVLYTTRYEMMGCVLCNLAIIAPFTLFDCAITVLEALLRTCHYYMTRELHTLLAVFLFPLIASHFSSFRQKHRVLCMLHTLLGISHVCVAFYINYDCNPNCDVDGKYGGVLELMLNLVTEMMCTDYSVSSNNATSSSMECNANKELHGGVEDAPLTTSATSNNNNKFDTNANSRKGKNNKIHENKEQERESNGFVLSADQMQLLRGECLVLIHAFVVALHTWVVNDPIEYAESIRRIAHQQHHHHQRHNYLPRNVLSSFLDAEEWAEMYLADNFDRNVSVTDNTSINTADANVPYNMTKQNQEKASLFATAKLCYHWKHVHYLLHNKRLAQEAVQLVNSGKWKDAQTLLSSRLTSSLQGHYFSDDKEAQKLNCEREQERQKEQQEEEEEVQKQQADIDNVREFALLAYFIYHYPGVDRNAISGIFEKINKDKDGASVKMLLQQYLRLFDYSALPIDVALRDTTCRFLSWDRPMFEAQVWMTIQSMFGEEYARQNAQSITAKDADTMAGVLLFLHSNLHNESARNVRMSCESFICDGNACLDIPFTEDEMRSMYVRTLQHKWELNQFSQTPREVSEQRPLVRLSGLMLHKLAVRVQQQREKERKQQLEEMQRALQAEQQQEEEECELANTTKSNNNMLMLHSNFPSSNHTSVDVEKLANEKMEIDATLLSLDLDEEDDDNDDDGNGDDNVDEEHNGDETKEHDEENAKQEHEVHDRHDEKISHNNVKSCSSCSSNSSSSSSSNNKEQNANNSDEDIVVLESEYEQNLEEEEREEYQQMKKVMHTRQELQLPNHIVEQRNKNINDNHEIIKNTKNKDNANNEVARQISDKAELMISEVTTSQSPHQFTELSNIQSSSQHPSKVETAVKLQNNNNNNDTKKKNKAHASVKNTTSRATYMYAWEGHLLDPVAPSYTLANNKLKIKEPNQLAYIRVALVHLTRLQTIHTKFYHSQCNYRPQPYIVPYYAEHARPLLHLTYSHIMTCLYVGLRVLENAPLLRQVNNTFDLLHELCDCLDISLSSLHSVMYDTIYQYLHDAQAYKLLPPSRATLVPFLMNTL